VYPSGVTLYPGYGPTSLYLYSTPFALVTNTADTGAGTLREAITDADGETNDPTWIVFNIPTSDSGFSGGVWTISPTSALPGISAQVVLDGTTQPGYGGKPIIDVDGTSAGLSVDGLTLAAGSDGSTIEALVINNFTGDGISVTTTDNTIESSNIGTTAAGTAAGSRPMAEGIVVTAAGNTIWGTVAGAGNVI
jgi:hypothetical protein